MEVTAISDDVIEGFWKGHYKSYPLYLIRDGSNAPIPQKPSKELKKWSGEWAGVSNTYFERSTMYINPLFEDVVKFDLLSSSGFKRGVLSGLARPKDNVLNFVSSDGESFSFTLIDENTIDFSAKDYTYNCSKGVSFDTTYTNKIKKLKQPNEKELGLVYSDRQAKSFKRITGCYYDMYMNFGQHYKEETDKDGIGAKVRVFGMHGYGDFAMVMIDEKDDSIMTAIKSDSILIYMTNNEEKYSEPPKTIKQWRKTLKPYPIRIKKCKFLGIN